MVDCGCNEDNDPEDGEEDEEVEYPVYEPDDYSGQTYDFPGKLTVWDPGLQRTIDATKSRVPEDSVLLEIETMFTELEVQILVNGFNPGFSEELDASFITLGGAYPGVKIYYPMNEGKHVRVKRPFTDEKLLVETRDEECPHPDEMSGVIWVANPEDQVALKEPAN